MCPSRFGAEPQCPLTPAARRLMRVAARRPLSRTPGSRSRRLPRRCREDQSSRPPSVRDWSPSSTARPLCKCLRLTLLLRRQTSPQVSQHILPPSRFALDPVLSLSAFMRLRSCGAVRLWDCGAVRLWDCGTVSQSHSPTALQPHTPLASCPRIAKPSSASRPPPPPCLLPHLSFYSACPPSASSAPTSPPCLTISRAVPHASLGCQHPRRCDAFPEPPSASPGGVPGPGAADPVHNLQIRHQLPVHVPVAVPVAGGRRGGRGPDRAHARTDSGGPGVGFGPERCRPPRRPSDAAAAAVRRVGRRNPDAAAARAVVPQRQLRGTRGRCCRRGPSDVRPRGGRPGVRPGRWAAT